MIKVVIKETGREEELRLINPFSKIDDIADCISFADRWQEFTRQGEAWVCSQATFDCWQEIIKACTILGQRIERLCGIHGKTTVYNTVIDINYDDFNRQIKAIHKRFDKAFSPEPTI
jgi:hypothetical protein